MIGERLHCPPVWLSGGCLSREGFGRNSRRVMLLMIFLSVAISFHRFSSYEYGLRIIPAVVSFKALLFDNTINSPAYNSFLFFSNSSQCKSLRETVPTIHVNYTHEDKEGYCLGRRFAPSSDYFPKTALASIPGSGNTWMRHLLEQLTVKYILTSILEKISTKIMIMISSTCTYCVLSLRATHIIYM